MNGKIGIIFIDTTEVIATVYERDHDLTPFEKDKKMQVPEIVEIFANISFSQIQTHVSCWKICARNVPEDLVHQVAIAIGLPSELLTLSREQELLCKGILQEAIHVLTTDY
jgi:hypothetical protein